MYSFVIYLKKCKVPEPTFQWVFPTGKIVHHFNFTVIKLWEETPESIQQTGLVALFPLMVLTKGGKRLEVVDEAIRGIEALGGRSTPNLLSLTYIFASFVFKSEADRTRLKRRFSMPENVLRKAWAYQEILQEGREEGLQKGLQEGREEGLQEGLQEQRLALIEIVQLRFPGLEAVAKDVADTIDDLAVLRRLIVKMSVVQTEEKAREALLEIGKGKKQK